MQCSSTKYHQSGKTKKKKIPQGVCKVQGLKCVSCYNFCDTEENNKEEKQLWVIDKDFFGPL